MFFFDLPGTVRLPALMSSTATGDDEPDGGSSRQQTAELLTSGFVSCSCGWQVDDGSGAVLCPPQPRHVAVQKE